MCGLAGIVDLDGGIVDPVLIEAMGDTIAHRGPDDRSSHFEPGVGLVHVRLAIIDPSEVGRQPFADATGRFELVFNGEIYNYVELRAELADLGHRFRTDTDTEVALVAYCEWGEACQARFRGMWALAIWDRIERRLFCSRDRFGIKPFYYQLDSGRLTFASELKAFTRVKQYSLSVNPRVARDYLAYGRVDHDDDSFLAGIKRLPPAHSLILDRGGARLRRYWALEPRDYAEHDAEAAVRDRMFDSVRLHLRSDVPIGTCLSGGLDSSAIACIVNVLLRTAPVEAHAVGLRQRTFTATFPGESFDERRYAEVVVRQIGADPRWVTSDDARILQDLPAIVWAQDEPFGSTSMVAQWFVMRAANEAGVKVMLDGQGGDEAFAGYHTSFGPHMRDLLLRGRLLRLLSEARSIREVHGYSVRHVTRSLVAGLATPTRVDRERARASGADQLLGHVLASAADTPTPEMPTGQDALHRQLFQLLTRTQLPELLRYEDRNSMAHGIEARVPFLDHELVELAFSLPGAELLSGAVTKSVVRRALSDLLPPTVRDRRDKIGFVTPLGRYLRGDLGLLAARVFASRAMAERGLVDVAMAQRRLELHRAGVREAGFEMWRALNLELWARRFIDGDTTLPES